MESIVDILIQTQSDFHLAIQEQQNAPAIQGAPGSLFALLEEGASSAVDCAFLESIPSFSWEDVLAPDALAGWQQIKGEAWQAVEALIAETTRQKTAYNQALEGYRLLVDARFEALLQDNEGLLSALLRKLVFEDSVDVRVKNVLGKNARMVDDQDAFAAIPYAFSETIPLPRGFRNEYDRLRLSFTPSIAKAKEECIASYIRWRTVEAQAREQIRALSHNPHITAVIQAVRTLHARINEA